MSGWAAPGLAVDELMVKVKVRDRVRDEPGLGLGLGLAVGLAVDEFLLDLSRVVRERLACA